MAVPYMYSARTDEVLNTELFNDNFYIPENLYNPQEAIISIKFLISLPNDRFQKTYMATIRGRDLPVMLYRTIDDTFRVYRTDINAPGNSGYLGPLLMYFNGSQK